MGWACDLPPSQQSGDRPVGRRQGILLDHSDLSIVHQRMNVHVMPAVRVQQMTFESAFKSKARSIATPQDGSL